MDHGVTPLHHGIPQSLVFELPGEVGEAGKCKFGGIES